MSQSNNSEESYNILFEINTEEAQCVELIQKHTQNIESIIFDIKASKQPAANELMSVDDFLDLIPANSYFH